MAVEKATNPGSFNEFYDTLGTTDRSKAPELYGNALDAYRAQLAADRGMHPEDLHAMSLPEQRRFSDDISRISIGELAVGSAQNQ